jgi:hypothetical protein
MENICKWSMFQGTWTFPLSCDLAFHVILVFAWLGTILQYSDNMCMLQLLDLT